MPSIKTSLIDTALPLDVSYVKSRPEANSLPVYNEQLLGVGWHSIHLRCRWSIHVSTASCREAMFLVNDASKDEAFIDQIQKRK